MSLQPSAEARCGGLADTVTETDSHGNAPLGRELFRVVAFEAFSWPILVAFCCWPLPVLDPKPSDDGCAFAHRCQPHQVYRGARCASRTLTPLAVTYCVIVGALRSRCEGSRPSRG